MVVEDPIYREELRRNAKKGVPLRTEGVVSCAFRKHNHINARCNGLEEAFRVDIASV